MKLARLLNKKSKYYLGRRLPDNFEVVLDNHDKSLLEKSLNKIEIEMCKRLIYNFIKIHDKIDDPESFRIVRIYRISKNVLIDFGLAYAKDGDGKNMIYLNYSN
jgi:hypothetical protein